MPFIDSYLNTVEALQEKIKIWKIINTHLNRAKKLLVNSKDGMFMKIKSFKINIITFYEVQLNATEVGGVTDMLLHNTIKALDCMKLRRELEFKIVFTLSTKSTNFYVL